MARNCIVSSAEILDVKIDRSNAKRSGCDMTRDTAKRRAPRFLFDCLSAAP